jgi:hypothetical protein
MTVVTPPVPKAERTPASHAFRRTVSSARRPALTSPRKTIQYARPLAQGELSMTKLLDPRHADTSLAAGDCDPAVVLLDANADWIDADDVTVLGTGPVLESAGWEEDGDEDDDLLGFDDDDEDEEEEDDDYDDDYDEDDDDFFDDEEDDEDYDEEYDEAYEDEEDEEGDEEDDEEEAQ